MNLSSLTKTVFAGLTALVMGGFVSDCNILNENPYPMRDSSIKKGIYECKTKNKTYRFNSEDPESKFLWTEDKGIKFKDLQTGDKIKLTEKQDYRCEPAGKTEKNNLNWVSVNIWDAFYPLGMDKTVPESLMALEVIFYQYYQYNLIRDIKEMFKVDYEPLYGERSRDSHFMMWIHLSDSFLREHPLGRAKIAEELFMYPDRETDLFIGWGGEANLKDFISNGVRGLANVLQYEDGTQTGNFQGFQKAIDSGNPEFEGGLLITNEQAQKLLDSLQTYHGLTEGYSFLSRIETKPNTPFESKLSQGVNGNNCGDFVYYALTKSKILPREDAEKAKKYLWYAEGFWNKPVPLDWLEILMGVGIFDEKKLTSQILQELPDYKGVRIWEPRSSISQIKNHTFKTKRVIEELLPATLLRSQITNPYPNGPDKYRFRDTDEYQMYLTEGHKMMKEKQEKTGITSLKKLEFTEKTLKKQFLDSSPTNQ